MRNVQHKKEAFWFYRFLSIFYDSYVNPLFWTPRMRAKALELAELEHRDHRTLDVGSGTGFTTQGIVKHINPENVFCIDQSPHQMAHARRKADLRGCHFQLGDAEDLPFPTDHFDRYVSAGSIEYWPEPQRAIAEAYRILKPGGIALIIGPVRPRNRLARFLADTWMLFPEEEAYFRWFEEAGFSELRHCYVAPHWVLQEKYGLAIAGTKPTAGASPLARDEPKSEDLQDDMSVGRSLAFVKRLMVGNLAGFLFIPLAILAHFLKPIRLLFTPLANPAAREEREPLTPQQAVSLSAISALLLLLVTWLLIR